MSRIRRGFTLIELMLSLVLISILALIAVPSYQRYIERQDLAMAKQAALKIAAELESYKARNFSYRGFNLGAIYVTDMAARNQLILPIGADVSRSRYVLTLVDLETKKPLHLASPSSTTSAEGGLSGAETSLGLGWSINIVRAKTATGEFKQPRNYDILLNSIGLRCMTQIPNRVQGFQDCGTQESQVWD